MQLVKSKNANINYLAKIVDITEFHDHPNPEVTRLKCATVDGWNIIVGIDEPKGKYIYFPTSCEINGELLSFANLYRHTNKNVNEQKSGFFEDNGRVKAIKLKGCLSEGFLLPVDVLLSFITTSLNIPFTIDDCVTGLEFDSFEHKDKSFWICKKYKVKRQQGSGGGSNARSEKLTRKYDRIIPEYFHFHYETTQVKKEPWCIQPDDLISITEKIHGTSTISALIPVKKPLNFIQKIGLFLAGQGWKEYIPEFDNIYASRSVIKNQYYNKSQGYYNCDVWGEANKIIAPFLQKGMTVYAEIVGYLPNGGYIQKDYDYGCITPKPGDAYRSETNFKVRVYRITLVSEDCIVHEFSAREVQQWCKKVGLVPVTEYYYGYAKDLYKDIPVDNDWNKNFWDRLANDKNFYMECNSPSCNNKVPHEGLVIKKEDMRSRAWKLKTFAFLNGEAKELDAGIDNIEDNA